MRIGHGIDVHAFAPERKLVLGGVDIPFPRGLAGHSDADVLTHALIDALLGALALGDIGSWFPDDDPAYKDAASTELLSGILDSDTFKEWEIINIDSTVIAEIPKILPHISEIRRTLSNACGISADSVSVKATTTETLGFCGREEGIAAVASVLIEKKT